MITQFLTLFVASLVSIMFGVFVVPAIERKLAPMSNKSPKRSAISAERPASRKIVVRYQAHADLLGGKKFRAR